MTRFQFHDEEVKVNEEELVDSGFGFDTKTFHEIRTAIFNNLLKNLQTDKVSPSVSKNLEQDAYKKNNFTPEEWTEIEKYLNKNTSVSHGDNNQNKNNNISPIIVITIIGLIILMVGGIVVMKSRQKKVKNGSKK